jgi:uncharacterized protein YjbI with pentapeptide repeats
MKFEIKARAYAGGGVLFTAELDAKYESEPQSVQLGAAVKAAVQARANLADANLADANLARANLADANLADANLADAYLADANLADANLARAYLADANLAGANLADANLAGANLADANLADANLADAYLADANLARAYLADANLAGANLADANLAGANLADANLADANLARANLADANLARAYLADANLAGANLAGANLDIKPATPEQAVAALDKVREIILDKEDRLYMDHWHQSSDWKNRTCAEEAVCGTTHCLAGWLQVCSTDPEIRKIDTQLAGTLCAPVAASMFFESNRRVVEWLREREYAEEAAGASASL